jgi:hypothetical protein
MSTTSSLKNVRSLLPGPFYNCLVPVSTNSGSLQPRQVVYSSCSILYSIQLLCGKYTEGFIVCQGFNLRIYESSRRAFSVMCIANLSYHLLGALRWLTAALPVFVLFQKCPTSHPESVLSSSFPGGFAVIFIVVTKHHRHIFNRNKCS